MKLANLMDRFFNDPKVQRWILLPLAIAGLVIAILGFWGVAHAQSTYTPKPGVQYMLKGSTCSEVIGFDQFYGHTQFDSDVFGVFVLLEDDSGDPLSGNGWVTIDQNATHCWGGTDLAAHADEIMSQAAQACEHRGRCKTAIAYRKGYASWIEAGHPLR